MKQCGIAAVIVLLVISALLAVWFDAGWAVSWHAGFYPFAAVPLLVALLAWRETPVRFAAVAYIAILLGLPFLSISPVKPFTRFFSNVHVGMHEDQVIEQLAVQFPEGGRFPRPVQSRYDDGSLCFQLDPNDGAYNAELVVVKMRDGRVVSKEYLPD
jgi:hypothetical protein